MTLGRLHGARLAKLEEAGGSGELPNGGIVVAVVRDGEEASAAVGRAMARPEVSSLSKSQHRRLVPVCISEADARC
jgi:hypothetical protein